LDKSQTPLQAMLTSSFIGAGSLEC
jgi:hypothetical protein